MKRTIVSVLISAAVVSAFAGTGSSSIGWKKTYPVAASEAKSSGKLIMIDFYTDWCGWCKKLDSDTYPAPEVVKASENFVPIKLNAEKDADGIRLAKKFGINGYPTVLFLDASEKMQYKIVGYSDAKTFSAEMVKASNIRHEIAKYEKALKANPKDVSALCGLAGVEAGKGDLEAATKHLDTAADIAGSGDKVKLLDTYNAVGDGYQNASLYEKAISHFGKAIADGYDKQSGYARISIASCLASMNRLAEAKPYLEALIKQKTASKEYLDQAKAMLAAIAKCNS